MSSNSHSDVHETVDATILSFFSSGRISVVIGDPRVCASARTLVRISW
ncbi:hypothetical protein [Thermomonospora sp. CIF 1]|nr:hypothetical protein [Thermomonospora sp. CIF 1]